MMTHTTRRLLLASALLLLPLLGCVLPAEPSRPIHDGSEMRVALGADITLGGEVTGSFVIADDGVVDVIRETDRAITLRAIALGTTEVAFESDEGGYDGSASIEVLPVARVELDAADPILVGRGTRVRVQIRDVSDRALDGSGLSRLVDAPVGTSLEASDLADIVILTPPTPGAYRVGVAVGEHAASQDYLAISIHDTDIVIEADDVSDSGVRWLDFDVRYEGMSLRAPGGATWTVDGQAVSSGSVPDSMFPAEVCVTVLDRMACQRIE